MTGSYLWVQKKFWSDVPQKLRTRLVFKKKEEKYKQLLIEKIIANIENKNPYEIKTEKEPEIMLEIEKKL